MFSLQRSGLCVRIKKLQGLSTAGQNGYDTVQRKGNRHTRSNNREEIANTSTQRASYELHPHQLHLLPSHLTPHYAFPKSARFFAYPVFLLAQKYIRFGPKIRWLFDNRLQNWNNYIEQSAKRNETQIGYAHELLTEAQEECGKDKTDGIILTGGEDELDDDGVDDEKADEDEADDDETDDEESGGRDGDGADEGEVRKKSAM